MDWSKLPDVAAVALLTCAFASVARHDHTPVSKLCLAAWILIDIHFVSGIFLNFSGIWESLALFTTFATLSWAGLLFQWAATPIRKRRSSLWMVIALLSVNTLYIFLAVFAPTHFRFRALAAALFGIVPLAIAIATMRSSSHPLRWMTAAHNCMLAAFLLAFQNRPGDDIFLALHAVLFTIYFGCSISYWQMYRRVTTGAFITISGFSMWSAAFLATPLISTLWPLARVDESMWNLPKYLVAVGMILQLLEKQIEHNKYLALHDELTGLPNRRLFQDRMASALERARRNETQTALLVLDMDRFKEVNDTLGHHCGDLLLQHVAQVFTGRMRRSDTVARTGGDEFSVILEESASRAEASRVSKSLLQLLQEPIKLEDNVVQVGASVGIAIFPDDASNLESLCIAADLGMYVDKQKNRNSGAGCQLPSPELLHSVAPQTYSGLSLAQ